MIKCNLSMVPPGGGEQDYLLEFELPALPRVGDFVKIRRDGTDDPGQEISHVRGVFWDMQYPSNKAYATAGDPPGTVTDIWVECEYVRGPFMTQAHKDACANFEAQGRKPTELPNTMY